MSSLESLELEPVIRERIKSWMGPEFDSETRKELQKLIDEGNVKSLTDRFYRDLEFGTGGLRGIMEAGTNRMNRYVVMMATQGMANYMNSQPGTGKTVAIAYDSRLNSKLFAEEAALVMAANGIKVFIFDSLRPTPEMSYVVRTLGTMAGINITASHNPKEYNGYKAFWSHGGQVTPPHDKAIIAEVQKIVGFKDVKRIEKKEAIKKGLYKVIGKEIDREYIQKVKALSLDPEAVKQSSKALKIIYTPLHGAGMRIVPEALKAFGLKNVITVPQQMVPDGRFPTVVSPNPEESEALSLAIKLGKTKKADLVLATDPDGDRLGIAVADSITGEFTLLNGNQLGSMLTYYSLVKMKEKSAMGNNPYVIKTIVTTDLVRNITDHFGVTLYECLTGFKYIAAIINEKPADKFVFGFEESYGFLAGDFVRDKDAVIAACLTAEAAAWAKTRGMTLLNLLDEVYSKFGFYSEKLKSLTFKGKEGMETIQKIMKVLEENPPLEIDGNRVLKILNFKSQKAWEFKPERREIPFPYTLPKTDALQMYFDGDLKVSIRPSGTEPKIKYYFSIRRENRNNDLPSLKKETNEYLSKLEKIFTDKVMKIAEG